MRKYCVYAIQSEVANRIYIGQTNCIERRIQEHNDGRVKSTRHEKPWKIVATEFFPDPSQARWFESSLKRSRGKRMKWLDEKISD